MKTSMSKLVFGLVLVSLLGGLPTLLDTRAIGAKARPVRLETRFAADSEAAQMCTLAEGSLTPDEVRIMQLVNISEACSYDAKLEDISLSHYAFRAAGSIGANETVEWIADQFESFGLEIEKEEFQFTSWDLRSKSALIIDDDGYAGTINDQHIVTSFQCEHYSLPVDTFADLVVLPLPPAANPSELGTNPIGTLWDSINTTGKIVLVGREVRLGYPWQEAFKNKLTSQVPVAVIFTWWYDWLSFVPDFFASAGGRPVTPFGHYFWDLGIAGGFVTPADGLLIRSRESSLNISARVTIDTVVSVGPHYNVVGRLPGSGEPDKSVIIMGHYDTVMSAGFCDNGAGTSGVIELARVFTEAARRGVYYSKYTLLFIGLAGEEIGLVGSMNYIAKHKAEMESIMAVINLDCIGSDILEITETDVDHNIDLDGIVLKAAENLGVTARIIGRDHSDEAPFLSPQGGDDTLMFWWDMSLGIGGAHPVGSSSMLSSSPLSYQDMWFTGAAGWIHTSNDNSTSTETLNWVESDDLEAHIKVAALSVVRISPSSVLITDLNKDGRVNILDVTIVALAFDCKPGDLGWNEKADLDRNGIINILDVSRVARDYGRTT